MTDAEFNAERQRLMAEILKVGDAFDPANGARLAALRAELKALHDKRKGGRSVPE